MTQAEKVSSDISTAFFFLLESAHIDQQIWTPANHIYSDSLYFFKLTYILGVEFFSCDIK